MQRGERLAAFPAHFQPYDEDDAERDQDRDVGGGLQDLDQGSDFAQRGNEPELGDDAPEQGEPGRQDRDRQGPVAVAQPDPRGPAVEDQQGQGQYRDEARPDHRVVLLHLARGAVEGDLIGAAAQEERSYIPPSARALRYFISSLY